MMWHVQYRENGAHHVVDLPTPEAAIETACRLIDGGHDVCGIGIGPLCNSIGQEDIDKIYDLWARVAGPPTTSSELGPRPS